MPRRRIFALLFLAFALITVAAEIGRVIRGGGGIELPAPPPTEAKPVSETVAGHEIADPYRWLEDAKSPETRAWIASQVKYTDEYLAKVKIRPEIVKRLTELERVESYSTPTERQGRYFFSKRLPDENQPSIYVRNGLRGKEERLVDATKLSADQNTSVGISSISDDGTLLVYGVREGGADETVLHVLGVEKHSELADVLPRARYSGVSFSPDKQGLYYARLETAGTVVYFHKFGQSVDSDQVIFGKKFGNETFGPMELISASVSQNGRYLLISVAHGVPAKRVDVYVKDLRKADSSIRPIILGIDNRFSAENYGDDLYVLTDYKAEKSRVIKINLNDALPEHWQTIVPEGKDVISSASIIGGKLFVSGLHDVLPETRIFTLDGKPAGTITYPSFGSASPVRGRQDSKDAFYTFESFNRPPAIYHYDLLTGKSTVFVQPKVKFDSSLYEVKQVFYTSKDGTRIPMFLTMKKGLRPDGKLPTLMFAYGGFNSSMTAQWNPEYAWWIEQGGVYAQPNLRGGGEYGEAWHKAGMFEKKQNVFDDFYAAAEYLISHKYTTPDLLAARGRSNGGLLMGAAMTQRPDLFGAIWCGYPLLDMIRFQKFLVGRWWTAEYGSADNPEQFEYLIKYSPYHNVKTGVKYPAIMFNSGDSDTRVDPLHAQKMTALMQSLKDNDRPVLLRYDAKAGHSSGVSITQLVTDTADELAFLWNETAGRE